MQPQYTCQQCSKLFTPRDRYRPPKVCSQHCAAKIAAAASRLVAKPKAPPQERACCRCGTTFTVDKPSSRKKHCSRACYLSAGQGHPKAKAKIAKTCEHCGATFEAFPFEADARRFCSKACHYRGVTHGRRGPSLEVTCYKCARQFLTWPYRARAKHHACPDCRQAGRPATAERRPCTICGSIFRAQRSQVVAGGGKYCSRRCMAEGQRRRPRKSVSRNSVQYREWRDAVYRRDYWKCQHCGRPSSRKMKVHAHHIKYWATHPELRFEVSNGITLCNSCHGKVHAAEGTPLTRKRKQRQLPLPF